MDDAGFCITDHSVLPGNASREDGSSLEFTFMPLNKEIRVEKTVSGDAPKDSDYTFQATQFVPTFNEKSSKLAKGVDARQVLGYYPYELYNAKTDQRVDDGSLKTDEDGRFSIKADQYAIFKVWELPEDFDQYEEYGFTIQSCYQAFHKDIATESRYRIQEVGSDDSATTITHKHNGTETQVKGKVVENVYGGDELVIHNAFAAKSADENPGSAANKSNTDVSGKTNSQSASARTGDDQTLALWIVLMGLSLAVATVAALAVKRS